MQQFVVYIGCDDGKKEDKTRCPLKFDQPVFFNPKKAGVPKLFGGKRIYLGQSRFAGAGLKLLKKWKAKK